MSVYFSLSEGVAQNTDGPRSYDFVVQDKQGITVAMFMSRDKALEFIDKVEKLMEMSDEKKMEETLEGYHFDLEQQKLIKQTWKREHGGK